MFRWFLATLAIAVAVTGANAAFTVTVVPTTGPFSDTTTQSAALYSQYITNSIAGLTKGTSYGNPSSLSYYAPGNNVGGALINSIDQNGAGVGLANGIASTTTYTGLLGNGFFFGVAIKSSTPGQTVSASQVSFSGFSASNSALSSLIPSTASSAVTSLGSLVGSNGLYGASTIGGTPTLVTSPTAAYQELYYTGVAGTIENFFGTDWTTAANLQSLIAYPSTPAGQISGTYSITAGAGAGTTGTGLLDVNDAPAPATFVLMGLGLSGIVARVRRRAA